MLCILVTFISAYLLHSRSDVITVAVVAICFRHQVVHRLFKIALFVIFVFFSVIELYFF